MRKSIFVTIFFIATILSFSFMMAESKSYYLPYKVVFNNLAGDAQKEVECLPFCTGWCERWESQS